MTTQTVTTPTRERDALFRALAGLTSLGVLLQAVWAGIFIRPGRPDDAFWVTVHARCAEVTIALALAAALVAFLRLRSRRDLLIGSAALALLLVLEAFVGGLIIDHPALEVVHFPLALGLMVLAVWVPFRARR